MKSAKLGAVMVAGALMLAGCGGGAESNEAQAPGGETETAEAVSEETHEEATESCYTVGEIGSQVKLGWESVVGARNASDQPGQIEYLTDSAEELYDDREDLYPCAGQQELADFLYELALLNVDVLSGSDTDEQYQKIADLGNDLLEVSDDEGYEWGYEFVSDASELDS